MATGGYLLLQQSRVFKHSFPYKTYWAQMGSLIGTAMFIVAIFKQCFPLELRQKFMVYTDKLVSLIYPYIHITFHEYPVDGFERSKAYAAIAMYLGDNSSTKAKRLKADLVKDSKSLVLSMDDYEEITDDFQGIQVWWTSGKDLPNSHTISWGRSDDERRYYTLKFHRRNRETITRSYLDHVLEEGKAVEIRRRQRKLYTNNKEASSYGYRTTMWSQVVFEHPATFETLALEPKKKKEIVNDLNTFRNGKDYYKKIGKAWKRGYLLYGPPGTGKSTMIAAIANLLEYDLYDLELTAVKDNTDLRKLLIETSSKSIIVIEDIDCSLDLTGQRKNKKEKEKEKEKKDEEKKKEPPIPERDEDRGKVTLSGLLNFIDGLWSACGEERIIIFTSNFVDKLDPALTRRGRMDKHIEMSYCCFQAFKILARNYLDLESHHLFSEIESLLGETNMTPADVAENLMPKSAEDDAETCLLSLIKEIKEAARLKAEEEEERLKAEEEEERLKAEEEEERLKAEEEEEKLKAGKEENGKEQKAEPVTDKEALVEEVKENGVVS